MIRALLLLLVLCGSLCSQREVQTIGRDAGFRWVWGHELQHWRYRTPHASVMLLAEQYGAPRIQHQFGAFWVGLHLVGPVNSLCPSQGPIGRMVWPMAFVNQSHRYSTSLSAILYPHMMRPVVGTDYYIQAAAFSATGGPCHQGWRLSSILKISY